MLEDDAALPVHDALGQAGGARRIEYPQRMVEGDAGEFEVLRGHRQCVAPGDPITVILPSLRVQVGHDHDMLQARQRIHQVADDGAAVEILAAVAVAVDREDHLRLDLAEAVDHALRAEVGRTTRPHRADRCRRQQRYRGLGNVRHVGDDTVARLDAGAPKPGGQPFDLLGKLVPAQLLQRPVFRHVSDRHLAGPTAGQDLFCVVQPGAREPLGAGHFALAQHRLVAGPVIETVVGPQLLPEPLDVLDRPAPKVLVCRQLESPPLLDVAAEMFDSAGGDRRFARLPQDAAFLGHWPLPNFTLACQALTFSLSRSSERDCASSASSSSRMLAMSSRCRSSTTRRSWILLMNSLSCAISVGSSS